MNKPTNSLTIEGIPWKFEQPEVVGAFWFYKLQEAIKNLRAEGAKLNNVANGDVHLELTKKRLRKVSEAKFQQAKFLGELLEPLSVFEAYAQRIPPVVLNQVFPNQNLLSYIDNIHRDWAWGTEENNLSADLLISEISEKSHVLFLGAGASRLAYDLHTKLGLDNSTLVDINPFLLLAAKKIIEGKSLKLFDFPISPLGIDNVSILNKFKANEPIKSGINYLFANAVELPIEANSFKCIVTPWLVDILPGDPFDLLSEIHRVLDLGGEWIHFGPLGFTYQEQKFHLTIEELKDLSSLMGFECVNEHSKVIPYMDNPHGQHARRENVYILRFKKIKEERPQNSKSDDIPEWLQNPSRAIELSSNMEVLKETHKVYHSILSQVDGRTSIEGIAKKLCHDWGISEEEAIVSLLNVFKNLSSS